MITDGKCFKEVNEKQQLNSDLLVATLLDRLISDGIINVATYERARKEVQE